MPLTKRFERTQTYEKLLTRFEIYDLKTNALKITNAELNGESKRRISTWTLQRTLLETSMRNKAHQFARVL